LHKLGLQFEPAR